MLDVVVPLRRIVSLALLVGCTARALPPAAPPVARPPLDASPSPTPDVTIDASMAPAEDAPPAVDATSIDVAAIDVAPEPPRLVRRADPSAWASAWTDPAAVRRLAANCNYRPRAPLGPEGGDPLHCATGIETQSCELGPCFDTVSTPCRRACGRTCNGCDRSCRAACRQCRAACHASCRDDEQGLCFDACLARASACTEEDRERCTYPSDFGLTELEQ